MKSHLFCRFLFAASAGFALCVTGCPLSGLPDVDPLGASTALHDSSSSSELDEALDRALTDNLVNRQLSLPLHGGWQVLHGILAYGQRFEIEVDGQRLPAVDHLLRGGPLAGFDPEQGNRLGSPLRPGLSMALQPTTKIGQGHRDQWLAVLAQSGLSPGTELTAGDHTFTMLDWVRQVEYDIPLNVELEFSWTLIGLLQYRDTDHRWTARDGFDYDIETLLASEIQQNLESSVCGGTHRLIGIATALRKRREEAKSITGVWADADYLVNTALDLARQNQNADGSYSASYLHRPGWTRDLGEGLGTTGHVLEFIAIAAPDHVVKEPWVQRSAEKIIDILDTCREIDLECGVLYHALHGLSELQARRSQ